MEYKCEKCKGKKDDELCENCIEVRLAKFGVHLK